MIVFCGRCDGPIRRDEEYETRDIMSPTGPGAVIYLHKRLCSKPPTQTSPVRERRSIREG